MLCRLNGGFLTIGWIEPFNIEKGLYEDWINGIFTKVILRAKNRNHLMKAVEAAEALGLKENEDFWLIKDCCLTELEPEETDEDLPDEDEEPGDEEGFEELDEEAGEVTEEAAVQKREVIISSSQKEIVTEGDQITLSSELRGFDDDEQVTYQWQVDRGDGNGWQDVEGATKDKHVFIADRTTIRYSWRLIVNVIDE